MQEVVTKVILKRPQSESKKDQEYPENLSRSGQLTASSARNSCKQSKLKYHNPVLVPGNTTDKYTKYKIKYMKYFNLVCNK